MSNEKNTIEVEAEPIKRYQTKDYFNDYYKNNKDAILAKGKVMVLCPECNKQIKKGNMGHHKSTRTHKQSVKITELTQLTKQTMQ